MHRSPKVKLLSFMMGLFFGYLIGISLIDVASALAQTPIDVTVLGVRTSMATVWAPLFIMIGGITIALAALYMLHAGPTMVLSIIIGFLVLALIAASANGTLGAFLGVVG